MIHAAWQAAGHSQEEMLTVPFPINTPERLGFYAPSGTTCFVVEEPGWGQAKMETLRKAGFIALPLTLADGISRSSQMNATEVRRRLLAGEDWMELLPPPIPEILLEIGGIPRLRSLMTHAT